MPINSAGKWIPYGEWSRQWSAANQPPAGAPAAAQPAAAPKESFWDPMRATYKRLGGPAGALGQSAGRADLPAQLGAGLTEGAATNLYSSAVPQPQTISQTVTRTAGNIVGYALPATLVTRAIAPLRIVSWLRGLGVGGAVLRAGLAGGVLGAAKAVVKAVQGEPAKEALMEIPTEAGYWAAGEVIGLGVSAVARRAAKALRDWRGGAAKVGAAAAAPKPVILPVVGPTVVPKPTEVIPVAPPPVVPAVPVAPGPAVPGAKPPVKPPKAKAPVVPTVVKPGAVVYLRDGGAEPWTVVDATDPTAVKLRGEAHFQRGFATEKVVAAQALTAAPQADTPLWRLGQREALYRMNPGPKPGETMFEVERRLVEEHRAIVAKALAEGKAVPPAVVAEYPDLARAGSAAQPQKPIAVVARGASVTAKTERGTAVQTTYAVVEADQLISSHDIHLRPDPRYPTELQPRRRGRQASEEQIARIGAHLEPEFLGQSPKASEGAPIIGPDGIVESGNARVIALKRLYQGNRPNAGTYRAWLAKNAAEFGIDAETLKAARAPVLVRIRQTPVDRVQFASEANEAAVAAMSAGEQAMADARKLTGDLIALFNPSEAGEVLTGPNRPFLERFFDEVIGPAEHGRYQMPDGSLSQEGVARIRNAVFARAFGDGSTLSALSKLAESPDSNIRNITNAMLIASGRLAKIMDGVPAGRYFDLDITPDIAAAAAKLAHLREIGQPVGMYLEQVAMFGEELSPLARDVLALFDEYARKPRKLTEILLGYAEAVERLGAPNQVEFDLLKRTIPSRASVLAGAIERVEGEGVQATLFPGAAGGRETGGRAAEPAAALGLQRPTGTPDDLAARLQPESAPVVTAGQKPVSPAKRPSPTSPKGRVRTPGELAQITIYTSISDRNVDPKLRAEALKLAPPLTVGQRVRHLLYDDEGIVVSFDAERAVVRFPAASDFAGERSLFRLAVHPVPATATAGVQAAPTGLPAGLTPVPVTHADQPTLRGIQRSLERLGAPIRVGRYTKQARGIYKEGPEVIRTRMANDLPVVAHEVGHHLDKTWRLSADPQHATELLTLAAASGTTETLPARQAAEGLAEFVRLFLTDPGQARARAPGVWNAFQNILAQNPEAAAVLDGAGQQMRALASGSDDQFMDALMSVGEKPRREHATWGGFLRQWVDELGAMKPFVKAAEGLLGRKLNVMEDPMAQAALARGWGKKAWAMLHLEVRDEAGNVLGPPLQEALKLTGGDVQGFRRYILARQTLEMAGRTRVLPGEGTKERAELLALEGRVVAKYGAKFQAAWQKLQEYQHALLRATLQESGLYSKETIDAMIAGNEAYIPLYRVIEAAEASGRVSGAGRGYVDLERALKKRKGSGRVVVDPLESIVKNTYLFTAMAQRAKVGRTVAELAEKAGGLGMWAERVAPKARALDVNLQEVLERADKELLELVQPMAEEIGLDLDRIVTLFRPVVAGAGKENIAVIWRAGEAQLWQLHPALYDALKWMDRESVGAFERFISGPATFLRMGAVVLNPAFWLRNPFRDQFTAFVYSKYGFVPGLDLVRGLFRMVRKDEVYRLFQSSGAASAALASFDRNYLQQDLKNLLRKGLRRFGNPLDWMQTISEYLEAATRVQEFARGLAKEGRTAEGLGRAGLAGRDVTIDFARAGTVGRRVNRWAAFFNAQIQGIDKLVRVFKSNPVAATAKAVACITLPTVGLYLLNRKDPNYWALSERERDLYWHFPKGDGSFVRFPKPFELGLLFGSFVERVMAWIDKTDAQAVDSLAAEMGPYLKNLLSATLPSFIPTAVEPLWEIKSNTSYTGAPLIPASEEGLEPRMQYGPYTSSLARYIGEKLNVSPRWIDAAVRGWTGGAGQTVLQLLDRPMQALGQPMPPADRGWPIIQSFVARPAAGGEPTLERFYRELGDLRAKYSTVREEIRRGQAQGLTPDVVRAALSLDEYEEAAQSLTVLRRIQREIMWSQGFTPRERETVYEILDGGIINLVRWFYGVPLIRVPEMEAEGVRELMKRAEEEYANRERFLKRMSDALRGG